jgi:hypothetical protein
MRGLFLWLLVVCDIGRRAFQRSYVPTYTDYPGDFMTHTAISANKTIGGLAAAALATAAFAASALGSAPPAHATCASFWGIGNGAGCTSTFGSVAIAIGTGAVAVTHGLFDTAIAVGPASTADVIEGALGTAIAVGSTGGILNTEVLAGH